MTTQHTNIHGGLSEPDKPAPWEKKVLYRSPTAKLLWALSTCLLIVLLATQILWHDGNRLAQNTTTRLWLERICGTPQSRICGHLHWQLPDYQNSALIDMVDHSVNRRPDGGLEFSVILDNRAELPQPYPSIRLALLKFNGDPLASRILHPDAYLPVDIHGTLMPVDNRVNIRFQIQKLNAGIGGYRFELL